LALIVINVLVSKYVHIMVWPRVVGVYVNEQALVVTNNCVVHNTSLLMTIKLIFV
jgi:hypothetical protein